MNLKGLLGQRQEESEDSGIRIVMSKVALPLDLALELVLRQQSQLFEAMNELAGQVAIGEAVVTRMNEKATESIDHIHKDIIEVRQAVEAVSKPEGVIVPDEDPKTKKLLS